MLVEVSITFFKIATYSYIPLIILQAVAESTEAAVEVATDVVEVAVEAAEPVVEAVIEVGRGDVFHCIKKHYMKGCINKDKNFITLSSNSLVFFHEIILNGETKTNSIFRRSTVFYEISSWQFHKKQVMIYIYSPN